MRSVDNCCIYNKILQVNVNIIYITVLYLDLLATRKVENCGLIRRLLYYCEKEAKTIAFR